MARVTIGEHFEIVLPPQLRDELNLKPGETVDIDVHRIADFPETDEPIGPETEAGIREGLAELERGEVSRPLRTAEEVSEYFARLKKR